LFIKILQEISTQNGNVFVKIKKLMGFKKFYKNLQNGIKNQTIFHKLENQNIEITTLLHNFDSDDFELFNKLLKKDVKEFLKQTNLKKNLNFQRREGSNQLGFNIIFVEKPLMGLWTTGKATFFIPTKKHHEKTVIIELQSVVPLKVVIEFEGKEIFNEEMPKLTTKKLKLKIPSSYVGESISELSINTNKLWLPSVILGIKESIRIGVKVESISVIG